MTLSIYIDFKNPASYLALKPTCAMLERLGIEARWLPFRTSEESIPERKPVETRGEQHRRVRARARQQTHLLYADVQGIEMRFRDTPGNTDAALAALALLDADALPFIHAAFKAYWEHGDDLGDAGTVHAIWEQTVAGQAPDFDAGHARLTALREQALEQRVFHAPSYLVGDQLFLGREHLPWVEALLFESKAG